MSADLQMWHPTYLADAKGTLLFRHVNTLNAPLTTSSWLGNGAAIADVYELIATKTGGVVTFTVDCLINGSKNPYYDVTTGRVAVCDGATVNKLIVPGVGLIFSASTDTGWKCRVAVGNYLETDGTYVAFFAPGIVEADHASTGIRVAVKNVGGSDAASVVLYSLPGLHLTGGTYQTLVTSLRPHSSTARHKLASAGVYSITFADWKTGGSGKKTADVYVDGVLAINDAEFDGATIYEWGSANGYDDTADKLSGLQLVLADTTTDPSAQTITLTVRDGDHWLQFASDSSGTPGTYSYQDLTITEAGQTAGTVRAGQAAYFWMKWSIPLGTSAGTLREMLPRLRGLTI